MNTNIIVTKYKNSGKYFTHSTLTTDIPIYETDELIKYIKSKLDVTDYSFTFHAESSIGINNHLVINKN